MENQLYGLKGNFIQRVNAHDLALLQACSLKVEHAYPQSVIYVHILPRPHSSSVIIWLLTARRFQVCLAVLAILVWSMHVLPSVCTRRTTHTLKSHTHTTNVYNIYTNASLKEVQILWSLSQVKREENCLCVKTQHCKNKSMCGGKGFGLILQGATMHSPFKVGMFQV